MDARDARDWTYLFTSVPRLCLCSKSIWSTRKERGPLHYAIVDTETAKPVGTAALMRIDSAHGAIEVGSIAYSPRIKRTRAGTEAMYLLMRLVFEDLGYRRYEWKCDSLNGPSRVAALRYGFTFEGIFRRAVVYKGETAIPRGIRSLRRSGPAYGWRSMPGSTQKLRPTRPAKARSQGLAASALRASVQLSRGPPLT